LPANSRARVRRSAEDRTGEWEATTPANAKAAGPDVMPWAADAIDIPIPSTNRTAGTMHFFMIGSSPLRRPGHVGVCVVLVSRQVRTPWWRHRSLPPLTAVVAWPMVVFWTSSPNRRAATGEACGSRNRLLYNVILSKRPGSIGREVHLSWIIESRPLSAPRMGGRRVVGGADNAVRPTDRDGLAKAATHGPVRDQPASQMGADLSRLRLAIPSVCALPTKRQPRSMGFRLRRQRRARSPLS
jgi:hypothetical protein